MVFSYVSVKTCIVLPKIRQASECNRHTDLLERTLVSVLQKYEIGFKSANI